SLTEGLERLTKGLDRVFLWNGGRRGLRDGRRNGRSRIAGRNRRSSGADRARRSSGRCGHQRGDLGVHGRRRHWAGLILEKSLQRKFEIRRVLLQGVVGAPERSHPHANVLSLPPESKPTIVGSQVCGRELFLGPGLFCPSTQNLIDSVRGLLGAHLPFGDFLGEAYSLLAIDDSVQRAAVKLGESATLEQFLDLGRLVQKAQQTRERRPRDPTPFGDLLLTEVVLVDQPLVADRALKRVEASALLVVHHASERRLLI